MNMTRLPPNDGPELLREIVERLRAVERRNSLRVGEWVLSTDDAGNLVATRPGEIQDVGNPIVEEVDLTSMRGYVSPAEIASAVSGGKTTDMSAATAQQVADAGMTANAQYTADNAGALAAQALAAIESGPGGVAYNDTLDGGPQNDLGANYDMFVSSGGNNYGLKGDGTAGMTTALTGAASQDWLFRYIPQLNTSRQRIGATWVEAPRGGSVNSRLVLAGRAYRDPLNPTVLGGRVAAMVEYNQCCIGYYLDGTPTSFVNLSGWVPCSTANGDSFDFWVGLADTGHDRFKFALLRNTLAVASADDLPENTAPLLGYRHGMVGVRAGVVVFFYITQTMEAPSLQSINIADRGV